MYQASVNKKTFEINESSEKGSFIVNNEKVKLDIASLGGDAYHIIHNNRSFNIEVVSIDKEKKEASIKVNNNTYNVGIKDQLDLLLSKLGMSDITNKKISAIKAPMPGLVVDILKKSGDEVSEGENLLILEAMKMENVIKSPINGVIKSIGVKAKDTVEKNQLLISFE